MTDPIRFTSNYNDLSTENGFQFEFICDKCQAGYRSTFDAHALGTATNVLETASNLLGGLFSSASNVANSVNEAKYKKAHDDAFIAAVRELSPKFIQCPHCDSWVCREKCWNVKKGLCKECAPDLGVEMAAAQASKSVEEVWAHAHMAEEDKKLGAENWRAGVVGTCPSCEKPLAKNAKFCPECGYKLHPNETCSSCGAKLEPNAKFCGDCGGKV